MSIVATEVESIHGSNPRMIFYRCQDSQGAWHSYGPVITTDPAFDTEAFKVAVAARVAERLSVYEFVRTVT